MFTLTDKQKAEMYDDLVRLVGDGRAVVWMHRETERLAVHPMRRNERVMIEPERQPGPKRERGD